MTPIQDRKDEKKYSIHPIRTRDEKLIRYDAIFHCCGYEDEDSFDTAFPAPYEKGVSTTFTESEAKEICDFFGWDFAMVAKEVKDGK